MHFVSVTVIIIDGVLYAGRMCVVRVMQVCGSPDIPLNLLKSVATYKGIDGSASLIQWFWEVMEEFSNTERSLFLRFVWGRTRLPRTIADFRGRDFVIQVVIDSVSLSLDAIIIFWYWNVTAVVHYISCVLLNIEHWTVYSCFFAI